jgi:signal transduction histidine kinase
LRWIDLPSGRYRAEVRASLDGLAWSAAPASFAVTVRAPWYLDPRIWALTAVAALAAAFLAQRARHLVALRLERQRTQIALDLHDEMGSGLGSIGILSGVLGGPDVTADEARRLATKIAEISGELGASLSDIVWSLRPRAGTLEEVAARLAEHGRRLFAGNGRRFETRLPDRWPDVPLNPASVRAVLLIGLEALHNAARHAAARQVTLAVAERRDGWDLIVEDDGRGLAQNGEEGGGGSGLGLDSMRRRAAEIGATIAWEGREGGGTRVTLRMTMRGAS